MGVSQNYTCIQLQSTTSVASGGIHHFELIRYGKQRNFTTETSPSSQTTLNICISTVQHSIQTQAHADLKPAKKRKAVAPLQQKKARETAVKQEPPETK